jgi:serine/threonine protein kinase
MTAGPLSRQSSGTVRVARILEEYQAQLESGSVPDRQALLAKHADIAPELAMAIDSLEQIRALVPALGHAFPASGESGAATLNGLPLGDFRVIREIGRGGMGIVYQAEQLSLGRTVALKVLPFAAALDENQLRRFRVEAQAAAQLEHPNIIGVYAVGSDRGVHFYAMQYVEGQPLSAIIRDLRSHAVAPLPDDASTAPSHVLATERATGELAFFHSVARLGMQAAEALAYAHSEGVIHRDIKPANLLVNAKKKLWIADFGLARIAKDSNLTQTRDVLGTARYMSPEQSLGQHDRIDQRTDIYSLGVTLYEFVTLEHAFAGQDRAELFRQIATEEPTPLSKRNPSIPADLETIILKAMAKAPEDRYATAQALAGDLERFLEDRPILAKRPTLWQKLKKFSRRHRRRLVAAAIVLVTGVVVGLGASTWFIWRALQGEAKARERAETREHVARKLIEDIYDTLAEQLRNEPRSTRIRVDVLRKSIAQLETLTHEDNPSPLLLHDLAHAYWRLCGPLQSLGENQEVMRLCDESIKILRGLLVNDPKSLAYRFTLFRVLGTRGVVSCALGLSAGIGDQLESLRTIEGLAADHPDRPAYQEAVSMQAINAAGWLLNRQRFTEAEKLYHQAMRRIDPLIEKHPEDVRYTRNRALSLGGLAQIALQRRRPEAEEYLRQALMIHRSLSRSIPSELAYRADVANCLMAIGRTLHTRGRPMDAAESLREAVTINQALAAEYPDSCEYRHATAECLHALGKAYLAMGQPDRASEAFQEYLTMMEKLADDFPKAGVYPGCICAFQFMGPDPRFYDCRRAVKWGEEALRRQPDRPEYHMHLGGALCRAGECQKSLAFLLEATRGQPSDVFGWYYLAMAQWQLGRKVEASQTFLEAERRTEATEFLHEDIPPLRDEIRRLLGTTDQPSAGDRQR